MSNVVEWSLANGASIQCGATRITPQCRVLTLRFPFGGFVWNRPTAVLVERDGELRQRLPIRDLTVAAQFGVGLVTLLIPVVLPRVLRPRKEHSHA